MSTRIQSAAAGALALLVAAIATPSAAGVVVQTKSFEHRQSLTTHLLNYNVVEDAPFNLHFDPFNGALGVLTGVSWTLDSTRKYEVGVSTLGGDVAYLLGENLVTSVKFGASPLGSGEDIGPMGPVACVANGAPACSALFQAEDDFDFDVAAANTFGFQQPGGVDAAFLSRLSLVGLALGDNVKNATAASSLRWDGNLSLTYTYRALTGPPPVIHPGLAPEPTSWALFFLGFGTAGAALRRRRETPAA